MSQAFSRIAKCTWVSSLALELSLRAGFLTETFGANGELVIAPVFSVPASFFGFDLTVWSQGSAQAINALELAMRFVFAFIAHGISRESTKRTRFIHRLALFLKTGWKLKAIKLIVSSKTHLLKFSWLLKHQSHYHIIHEKFFKLFKNLFVFANLFVFEFFLDCEFKRINISCKIVSKIVIGFG